MEGFEKITHVAGFNLLNTETGEVREDDELFLKMGKKMISLGTLQDVESRSASLSAPFNLFDKNERKLGRFGTSEIDDNLFIKTRYYNPVIGQMARGKQVNSVGAHKIAEYLPGYSPEDLNDNIFPSNKGGKTKRRKWRRGRKGRKTRRRKTRGRK